MSDCYLQGLLIKHQLVTRPQLGYAIESTLNTRCTWLERLVLAGALDEDAYCKVVSRALFVPCASGRRVASVPREALVIIPAAIAVENRLVPLWLEPDGDLHVAMIDPMDSTLLEEIGFFSERYIVREVAGPTMLAWALHRYYGVTTALWPPASARTQAAGAAGPLR